MTFAAKKNGGVVAVKRSWRHPFANKSQQKTKIRSKEISIEVSAHKSQLSAKPTPTHRKLSDMTNKTFH
jgi:hypothetical protein